MSIEEKNDAYKKAFEFACSKAEEGTKEWWEIFDESYAVYKESIMKETFQTLLKTHTPVEIEDATSSDLLWGERFKTFFETAYADLENGVIHEIPEKWQTSREALRYMDYVEIYK